MMMLGLDGLDVRRTRKQPPVATLRADGNLLYRREHNPNPFQQTNYYLPGAYAYSARVKA